MDIEIKNDIANQKFVANVTGGEAVILYSRGPGRVFDLYSTRVPPQSQGQHIGEALVREAIHQAEVEDVQIVATCPFVKKWFEKHPEEQSILAGHQGSSSIEHFY